LGAEKIMVIRHAEKPGSYGGVSYKGVQADGKTDKESLVTLGWERGCAAGPVRPALGAGAGAGRAGLPVRGRSGRQGR
jgi:hypothetical protein